MNPWMQSSWCTGKRIKVRLEGTTGSRTILAWKGGDYEDKMGIWTAAANGAATVRFDLEALSVPEHYVRLIRPTMQSQKVVPIEGEHEGKVFSVVRVNGDECDVKDPKVVRRAKTIALRTDILAIVL